MLLLRIKNFNTVIAMNEILFTFIVLRWRQKGQGQAALVARRFKTFTM